MYRYVMQLFEMDLICCMCIFRTNVSGIGSLRRCFLEREESTIKFKALKLEGEKMETKIIYFNFETRDL